MQTPYMYMHHAVKGFHPYMLAKVRKIHLI